MNLASKKRLCFSSKILRNHRTFFTGSGGGARFRARMFVNAFVNSWSNAAVVAATSPMVPSYPQNLSWIFSTSPVFENKILIQFQWTHLRCLVVHPTFKAMKLRDSTRPRQQAQNRSILCKAHIVRDPGSHWFYRNVTQRQNCRSIRITSRIFQAGTSIIISIMILLYSTYYYRKHWIIAGSRLRYTGIPRSPVYLGLAHIICTRFIQQPLFRQNKTGFQEENGFSSVFSNSFS